MEINIPHKVEEILLVDLEEENSTEPPACVEHHQMQTLASTPAAAIDSKIASHQPAIASYVIVNQHDVPL